MAQMTKHRERLSRPPIRRPINRTAVALWRHFPGDNQRPADLAQSQLIWQREYDWDFIKVSPSSSFHVLIGASRTKWQGGDEVARVYTNAWSSNRKTGPRSGRSAPLRGITPGRSAAWS